MSGGREYQTPPTPTKRKTTSVQSFLSVKGVWAILKPNHLSMQRSGEVEYSILSPISVTPPIKQKTKKAVFHKLYLSLFVFFNADSPMPPRVPDCALIVTLFYHNRTKTVPLPILKSSPPRLSTLTILYVVFNLSYEYTI